MDRCTNYGFDYLRIICFITYRVHWLPENNLLLIRRLLLRNCKGNWRRRAFVRNVDEELLNCDWSAVTSNWMRKVLLNCSTGVSPGTAPTTVCLLGVFFTSPPPLGVSYKVVKYNTVYVDYQVLQYFILLQLLYRS